MNVDLLTFPYEKLGVEPTREPPYRSIKDRTKDTPKSRKKKAQRRSANQSAISVEIKKSLAMPDDRIYRKTASAVKAPTTLKSLSPKTVTNPSIGKGLQNPTAGVSPHDVYYPVKLAVQREAEVKRTVENEVARLMLEQQE